ncbi:sulfatase family protein [Flavobacterium granuli]|uniref:Arylsulfatase A n=1 Tax=Flavobacterium granuli TaxID=280093 RepID=A0A1M5N5V1_9FLAO|nr:arylsulfatase [Flavobacterium granuli]PRZ25199.1 arylsulfatase A-like enzyme [Flavobacterium granuli]SHG84835.1 Arylsulfatase A [Flavobacterium granuli]
MRKLYLLFISCLTSCLLFAQQKPNVVFIYVDDLGYGDLSCYGTTKINTPNIDKLAKQGIRFTNAHSTSATCTPSRYALMTGLYPWRKAGTGVLPGDAALIIPTDKTTLPSLFQKAGYQTGIVGKWHLGLGDKREKEWNGELKPGPNEVGFDYSFIFPATADRVPTVFVENHHVVALDANDLIQVDYNKKIGNDPTGIENPELLKMHSSPDHGHNNTIVNGIGRIGYMSGGNKARWTDEEMPLTFLAKAKEFIDTNKQRPFFLYYSLTEPHVPRMPSTMFKGKSNLGYRGDAILQMDWAVGEIMKQLENLGLAKNTMIIFSSDNGPVLDDGYQDEAVSKLNGHTPAGILRGGKYSTFEAGTRIPLIISWPAKTKVGVTKAVVSQIDFLASFSNLLKIKTNTSEATDSENMLDALLGKTSKGRTVLIEQGTTSLAILKDNWKYIEPNNRAAMNVLTNTELGNNPQPQLYDLNKDLGERENLANQYPKLVNELAELLQKIKNQKNKD